ncbi:S-adenosyl-L-methionine-dependent methyltransferase [Phascolomyces articulosus]|uniref:S-adenosyl-L-methionine-dependent methyltransferase n=1 Tax=Phascolomyces articulosus TaxID=60185 RepID=A0AAD5PCW2_9FUNG|nr:S-adenosyl-L-methionine-dependent methyltransferase [Phascolomyces articulosus]
MKNIMDRILCFSLSRLFSKKDSSRKSNKKNSTGTDLSAARHRYDDQGRRYHNRNDAVYILPDDDEEIDRIHMQHWVLKIGFQGNFDAPLKKELDEGITVLDGGCGPGTWSLEMAKEFPRSDFYGVDISEVFPSEIKPPNCNFQVHNLSNPLPFTSEFFDYIFQRMLVLGIMRDDWDKVLSHYMDALKPGGWIELTEVNIPDSVNAGPKLSILMNTLGEVAKQKGVNPSISSELESKLKKAGAVNTVNRRIEVPMHHGGKLGMLLWEDFVIAFRGLLKPFVAKKYPEYEDEEAYIKFIDEVAKECEETQNHIIFYRAYGQKPSTPTAP